MATAAAPQPNTMALARQKVVQILTTDEARKQIAPLLQPGVSLERVISTINQVVAENPEILDCTPESIVMAVGRGVKWDLDFGETVHLVPFNVNVAKRGEPDRWEKRAKAIRDYKGSIELVVRSGAARSVDAHVVYANEVFKYAQGAEPWIEHHPIAPPGNRGQMIGAYAIARLNWTMRKIVYMSIDEIDAIRQAHSKQWKKGAVPAWYAMKTCVHQVTKMLPKNPKLASVLASFEEEEEIPEGQYEVVDTVAAVDSASQSAKGVSVPSSTESATPAAAAATEATPALIEEEKQTEAPDPAAMTLEQAKALKLFGGDNAWGGQAGKLLENFSTGHLKQIKKWCVERIEASGDDPVKQTAIVAIDLILADRAQQQQPAAAR